MSIRWFVEIAHLGPPNSSSPTERHCVEADSWRNALMSVRKFLGLAEKLGGMSVEVLSDGVRVVDPLSRNKFTITKAPTTQPLTIAPENVPKPQTRPVSTPPPATKKVDLSQTLGYGNKKSTTSPPPANDLASASTLSTSSRPPSVIRPHTSHTPATKPAPEPSKPAPSQPPATSQAPSTQVNVSSSVSPKTTQTPKTIEDAPPTVQEPPSTKLTETKKVSELFKIISQRFEEPTEASPIAYREVAYALEGDDATEETATSFLMARFEELRSTLSDKAPGKLINLAAFDHVFTKRPKSPPLVTLVWKDWKSKEPEIRYPKRPGQSIPPASLGSSKSAKSQRQPQAPSMQPQSNAPSTTKQPSAPPSATEPVPLPAESVKVASKPTARKPFEPTMQSASSTPTARRTAPTADIVADIFEAMHDMYFLQTPPEAAEYILTLMLEKFQSAIGIVQLYDINHRQFVVVASRGPHDKELIGMRTAEADPFLKEVMLKHEPFIIDAAHDDRLKAGRWQTMGVNVHWLLASGVQLNGRFLGTVEIAITNANDEPFGKIEIDALTYIVERFAEFVVQRGLVFSEEEEGSPLAR